MRAGSRIRVLHVITRMVRGGAQENTLATVAGIRGPGWQSTLAAGPAEGPEGSLEGECAAAGVPILAIPDLVRELAPRRDLTALARLAGVMRKERPHVVHTHTSKAGILGRLAARAARVPVVVHTPHGHVFHGYGGRAKTALFIAAERLCVPLTDRLVALTESERREHLEMGVGRASRWTIIHSGVDFAPFEAWRGRRREARAALGLPEDAVVVGTVGRLVPIKGQDTLIDAFAATAAGDARFRLLLVGDGPLRAALIARAREQGLEVRLPDGPAPSGARPAVHFAGLRRDVPRQMAAMDLFALPSLNEGMGRVLVEAMSMELPCVASRVSGIQDVVADGVTGLLVPPRQPETLAAALSDLTRRPERAREMGGEGRRRVVPAYGVEQMVRRLEDLYRELLRERGLGLES